MKIHKICTRKNRGQDKKPVWNSCGILFEGDDGRMSGYMFNNPDVQIYLFEQKPKETNGNNQSNQCNVPVDTSFDFPDGAVGF
jgi:hypothetical protein